MRLRENRWAAEHVLRQTARRFSSKKGRVTMTYFERLVEAGIRPDCAMDTCHWFQTQGDDSGLKRYVQEVEEKLGRIPKKECGNSGV